MTNEQHSGAAAEGTSKAVAARFRFDPAHSRFTVQAFAGGFLGSLGHNPTFAVGEFSGQVLFDSSTPAQTRIELTAQARSLDLLDRVRPADRDELQDRMNRDVLQTQTYPQIHYESRDIAVMPDRTDSHQYRLRIDGVLSLHGITLPHRMEAVLQQYTDGIRISGASSMRLSDFGIGPVKALAGAIRLQDELRLHFDLVAWKEAP